MFAHATRLTPANSLFDRLAVMSNEPAARTTGIDHVGLTVPNLDATTEFFLGALGWSQIGGDPRLPGCVSE